MTMDLEFRLRPSARAPAAARQSLSRLGRTLEPDVFENVKLLVTELVTNSIRHAGMGEKDEVAISVAAEPDRVVVTVTDPGRGFPQGQDVPRPDPNSGWGLYLVDRIAERWGIAAHDVTTVWFELRHSAVHGDAVGGPPR